ncbi:hypothetical protein DXG01_013407 [Tephrocybe rancida]|nr:hypothetical protein DXG01_013407 [Tephrocybe rancida]
MAGVVLVADSGRIWWVARSVQPLLDSQQAKRYHTATAIIIESGAIYPLSVFLLTVTPPDKKYRLILLCIALRVVRHEDETDTSVVTRVQDWNGRLLIASGGPKGFMQHSIEGLLT